MCVCVCVCACACASASACACAYACACVCACVHMPLISSKPSLMIEKQVFLLSCVSTRHAEATNIKMNATSDCKTESARKAGIQDNV